MKKRWLKRLRMGPRCFKPEPFPLAVPLFAQPPVHRLLAVDLAANLPPLLDRRVARGREGAARLGHAHLEAETMMVVQVKVIV
jgi:hypothetical protein